ncbi:MAG: class I SAM-dependent methyltransferase [Candidatus Eisenbacteria bacterium]|nr:class I SAM-dependent methyltransferase [Candidatus Eisenbacteria bacterium]
MTRGPGGARTGPDEPGARPRDTRPGADDARPDHRTDRQDRAILAELAAHARAGMPEMLQFGSLASAHQYLPLHRLWRRNVPAGAEVLDWGAGNGHFSYFLVRGGWRATGFSFMPFLYEPWLPKSPAYRYVPGSESEPVKLPFADASFDAVASIGVLEHVRETGGNEPGSLGEIARVLRPGGVFVCWHFPNRWSWIDSIARHVPGKHRHFWRYTRDDIRGLVAGAGLELLETRRYGVIPRNNAHRLLGPARDAAWAADLWDAVDDALSWPLNAVAQNHCFVARRPVG